MTGSFLLDAPLSPSGLFGDAVDTVVDRHQEAGRQAAAFRRFLFLPRRSLTQGAAGESSPCRVLVPHIGKLRKRALPPVRLRVGGVGVVRRVHGQRPPSLSRICGPFFRLGSLRPRSPDICGPGLMRVAPAGVEQRSPQRTVPVSPQCPQEIDLPTLPLMVSQAQWSPASTHLSLFRPET